MEACFLAPKCHATDLDINPYDKQAFLDKTKSGGTMGDLYGIEAQNLVINAEYKTMVLIPTENGTLKDYSKTRKGVKHHLDN